MGNVSRSEMIYDADATQAVSELQRLVAAERMLKKEMREAAIQANKGSKEHEASLKQLSIQYLQNRAMIDRHNQTLRAGTQELAHATAGAGKMRGATTQLTFAMDDFLTVLQMPGMGLIPALRASANNFSAVLAPMGAMYGLIPVLATSAATLAMNLYRSADAQEEVAKTADKAIRKLQEQLELMRAVEGEREGIQRRQEFLAEIEPLRAQEIQLQGRRRELIEGLRRQYSEGNMDPDLPEEAREQIRRRRLERLGITPQSSDQEVMAALARLGIDRRGFMENVAARRDVGAQINLIEQRKALQEQQAAQERQRQEQEQQIRRRLSQMSGPLSQFAAQQLAAGVSAEQVQRQLFDTVDDFFGDGEQQFLETEIAGLVEGARGAAATQRLTKRKPPRQMSADERRTRELQSQMTAIRAEMQESLIGVTSPDRQRRIRQGFARRLDPLEAEQTRLQAKLQKEALKKVEDNSDEQILLLTDIRDALMGTMGPPTGSPGRREVERAPSSR